MIGRRGLLGGLIAMTWGDRTQPRGTGRQPVPMNAPPAQPLGIGVQPGTPNVIRARLVVISGTGPGSGLFVYSPTPAAGNLLVSITAAAGTDPYGNVVQQGFTSYSSPIVPELGSYLQILQASLVLSSNLSGTKIRNGALINLTDVTAATAGPVLNLISPGTQLLPQVGRAEIKLVGESSDGATVLPQVLTDTIFAFDPNVAAHSQAETWHNMPAMQNGWSIGGHAQYRLTAQGDLQVSFKDLLTGTDTDGTAIWAAGSLPAAYQVGNNHRVVCYCDQTRVAGTTTGMSALEFETDGSVQCFAMAGGATRADLYATIPLV